MTAASLVLLSLLGSCGGSDDASPGPTTRKSRFAPPSTFQNEQLGEGSGACGLLREAEVEAAVGAAVSPGSGVRTRADESCSWRVQSQPNYFVGLIAKEQGREAYDKAASALAGVEPISGVGDRAFASHDTAYALKGERMVIIQVLTTGPTAERKQAAIRLMEAAIGRG